MTLGEAKNKVYMLLDEHSAGGEIEHDEDIEKKMTAFFDMAQKTLAQIKKILREEVIVPTLGKPYTPCRRISTRCTGYGRTGRMRHGASAGWAGSSSFRRGARR